MEAWWHSNGKILYQEDNSRVLLIVKQLHLVRKNSVRRESWEDLHGGKAAFSNQEMEQFSSHTICKV